MFAHVVTTALMLSAQTADNIAGQGPGSLDIERLRPALDGAGIVDVESGRIDAPAEAGLLLNYAYAPLVAVIDGRTLGIVNHRANAHLTGSLAFGELVRLGVEVPVVVYQAGPTATPGVLGKNPVAAFGLDDVRVTPKFALLRSDDLVDLAIALHITLPTSLPRHQYIGDGLPTFAPEVNVSRAFLDGSLRVATNVGGLVRVPSQFGGAVQGQELTARAGVAYSLKQAVGVPVEVSATLNGALLLFPAPLSTENNPLEGLMGVGFDVGDTGAHVFGAVGSALVGAPGTPAVRALAGVRFAPKCDDPDGDSVCLDVDKCPNAAEDADGFEDGDGCLDDDNDRDGVLDAADKCRDVAGVVALDGCADMDSDGDTVPDSVDRCRTEKEDLDMAGDDDGCPEDDADNDGVRDLDDSCPAIAEDKDNARDDDGCPGADEDGDGLLDGLDKCPSDAETFNSYQDADGCPDAPPGKPRAELKGDRVELSEEIAFVGGTSTIAPQGKKVLDALVALLKARPDVLMRIEGRSVSEAASDQRRADARAKAVRAYLAKKGVDDGRLGAIGKGAIMKKGERALDFVIVSSNTDRPADDCDVPAKTKISAR